MTSVTSDLQRPKYSTLIYSKIESLMSTGKGREGGGGGVGEREGGGGDWGGR